VVGGTWAGGIDPRHAARRRILDEPRTPAERETRAERRNRTKECMQCPPREACQPGFVTQPPNM
jgi:hypothetical protein